MATKLTEAERFWSKVDKNGPWSSFFGAEGQEESTQCWVWTGALGKPECASHGRFQIGQKNSKVVLAHRWAWIDAHGEIPDGMCVLHHCDNPPCVRVSHLFLGTRADNLADMRNKNRHNDVGSGAGENNPASKFSDQTVEEVRRRYRDGETQISISLRLNISPSQVNNIVHGRQRMKE